LPVPLARLPTVATLLVVRSHLSVTTNFKVATKVAKTAGGMGLVLSIAMGANRQNCRTRTDVRVKKVNKR